MLLDCLARPASLALALLLAPLACGDDDGTDTGAETAPVTGTSEAGSTSTGEPSTSTSTDASTSSSTGTLDDSSTTAAGSSSESSGGPPAGDPTYPLPDAGGCPDGTLEVALPNASICAPFCGGPDDVCPPAASGEASPACVPFAGPGGSGDPCDEVTQCSAGETCQDGTCSEVAFHACQLLCDMGQLCPDDMVCSGIATCGYP